MPKLYFNKHDVEVNRFMQMQNNHRLELRSGWERTEQAHGSMHGAKYNAAARLPEDAFREFDRTIKEVMAGDEGGNIVSRIPVQSVDIGKIVQEYGVASDSGNAKASISGRKAHEIDRATFDYDGTLVLIHDDTFGVSWREFEAMRSEGFDIQDSQRNSVRAVARSMANHVVEGVDGVSYKGSSANGIKSSPNTQTLDLSAGTGLGIDLTDPALTIGDMEAAFIGALQALQGSANNVDMDITIGLSADIWFNLLRCGSNDSNFRSFLEHLQNMPGVAEVFKTNGTQLSGNEFIAFAADEQYIQIKSAMAVNVEPVIRTQFNDDVNFVTWGAAGILIKRDAAGRSGVLWAREVE